MTDSTTKQPKHTVYTRLTPYYSQESVLLYRGWGRENFLSRGRRLKSATIHGNMSALERKLSMAVHGWLLLLNCLWCCTPSRGFPQRRTSAASVTL